MRVARGKGQQWLREVAIPYLGAQCLIWPFCVSKGGYPQTWEIGAGPRGGQRLAHVVVCIATHGPRPPGHDACHSCGNKRCVSPAHLRWDTKENNQADRRRHGTISVNRGTAHGRAKLDDGKVKKIRASTSPARELAELYGVSVATIGLVRGHRIWVHVL
jgi:hypothetical protein